LPQPRSFHNNRHAKLPKVATTRTSAARIGVYLVNVEKHHSGWHATAKSRVDIAFLWIMVMDDNVEGY
ncbi:hypothetical protein TELCIR_23725, partial [Teladorsagia circumcincta]